MNKIKQIIQNNKSYINHKSSKVKFNFLSIKNNENIIKSESSQKLNKIRNPGIELGRILAMFGIIIHHILLHGNAITKYSQYKDIYKIYISLNWHVSMYIFISGYVGFKTTKYSNLQ